MKYYKDNPNYSRYWAWAALLLYGVVMGAALLWLQVNTPQVAAQEPILVELVPLPEPEPEPQPVERAPQMHDTPSEVEQREEVRGPEPETRTANPRALFRQSQGGVDEPENAGNPHAEEADKDSASGTKSGLSPEGSDWLDTGLQGRGLVGSLPKPRYTGNASGKVVIRVTVDAAGHVTSATYEPKGSTTSDPELIREAREAALRARFTESRSHLQGGLITYLFTLKR